MQYVKIKQTIVEQIEAGMLSPMQKLPAERKLAESFDTTRVTLREALSLLEAEGKIFREDRRGWFISPAPLAYNPWNATGFDSVAQQQSRKAVTKLISAKTVIADKQVSQWFNLPPFSEVHKIERLRYLDDRPVAIMTSYVLPDVAPTLLEQDLASSLTNILQAQFNQTFSAIEVTISNSSLLDQAAVALHATDGTPTLIVQRCFLDSADSLIELRVESWRHDAIAVKAKIPL